MIEGHYKLPEGWRWVRLGEVFYLRNGKFIRKADLDPEGSVPVYGSNGLLGYTDKTLVDFNTIIIGRVGTCGAINIPEAPCWVSDNAMYVSRFLVDCDRMFVALAMRQLDLSQKAKKGAQPSISQSDLYKCMIPFPPLTEQRRIVARIEGLMARVREARQLREEVKRDIDRLMQAALAEVFPHPGTELPLGWRWAKLGEVARRDSVTVKPCDLPGYTFKYLGMEHVLPGQWEEPQPETVLASKIKGPVVLFRPGHVLYGKLRPYLNKVVVPSTEGVASTEFVPISTNQEILTPQYLGAFLRSPSFVAYASQNTTGSRQPRVRLGALWDAPMPLPPLSQQHRLVEYLDTVQERIKTLREAQSTTEAKLQCLEQSVLDRAIRGEL